MAWPLEHTESQDLAESLFLKTVLSRRQHADVDENLQVAVVSPEDLIVLKVLAGRPRDAIDVQDVLFMQGELDRDYMRHWAERLGVLVNLDEALAKFDEEMPDRLSGCIHCSETQKHDMADIILTVMNHEPCRKSSSSTCDSDLSEIHADGECGFMF